MPLISPFGHIIKGQCRHLCSREKLLSGVIKREKIKKATCKREAQGAEEVCPCNSSAVTSHLYDKINGNTLSSIVGNWVLMALHRWWTKVCDSSRGLPAWKGWQRIAWFGSLDCFLHSSVPGIHLPQVDQGAFLTKTFPTHLNQVKSLLQLI